MRFCLRSWPLIGRLLQDQRGGAAILVGLSAVGLCGVLALAIDGVSLYLTKDRLQSTADAAALAAAKELPDNSAVQSEAFSYALANMRVAEHGHVLNASDIAIGRWDATVQAFTQGAEPANAVRVVARRAAANGNPAPTYFATVLGIDEVDIRAESTAVLGGSPVCILALDPTGIDAVDVGNGAITANGCVVHVNSEDPDAALSGQPNGAVTAEAICVVGGSAPGPLYAPTPSTGCSPLVDPLADLATPVVGACEETDFKWTGGDTTLDPGVYCGGIELTSTGTITFNPGLYIIKDGLFKVVGGATLVGDGITFHVTGSGAGVDFGGASEATLSAPITGSLAGVLFFGDRDLTTGTEFAFKGGPDFHFEGTIYAPTAEVRFAGHPTAISPSPYTIVIAYRFAFNGIGELVINANYADSTVPVPVGLGPQEPRLVM